MKTKIFYAAMLAFVLVGCDFEASGGSASAAYVNIEQVFRTSSVGKSLEKQIKKEQARLAKKMNPQRKKLERDQKKLARQRSTLSAAVLQTREREWNERVSRFQQEYKENNESLQAGLQEAQSEINVVLEQIYEEVRKDKGVSVLLNGQAILSGSSSVDVTDDIVELLDERLPKVVLEVPKG